MTQRDFGNFNRAINPGADLVTTQEGGVRIGGIDLAAFAKDSSGNVTGLVGPDGVVIPVPTPGETAVPLFGWATGDTAAATAVSVGTPITTRAIDMSWVADGSLYISHTGGTLGVTYALSENGVTWSVEHSLASSLSAGLFASLLSAIRLESGFFRLTFTATGSTCNVKSFYCATSARASLHSRVIQRCVLGTGPTFVSMTAAEAAVSPPIDITTCIRGSSVLRIMVASGTVKVSAAVSRDGSYDLYSLGDLQTGMTAGKYEINLGTLLQYGHFVTFTITETAGAAASVYATAILNVADEFAGATNVRRAAVVAPRLAFAGTEWTNNHRAPVMDTYRLLQRLGYDAEIVALDDASAIFDNPAKTHDLFIMPYASNYMWTTWASGTGKPISRMLKGTTPVPVFVIGCTSSNNAALLANIGAGVRDTEAARKILVGAAQIPYYATCGAYAVTVQAHMGDFKTVATDSAASGKVAWAYTGSVGRVYVGAGFNGANDGNMLPILLAEAFREGVVEAPPRKAKMVLDIDDMPDSSAAPGIMTLQDISTVYNLMSSMSMPCAFGIRTEDIVGNRQLQAVTEYVMARTADKGGLIYPIAHSGSWFWKDGNKATKDATFRGNIAVSKAVGIPLGRTVEQTDAWGYTYFNNNAFDEESLELGQPGQDFTASTTNANRITGYGWRVIRAAAIGVSNTEGFGAPRRAFGDTYYRGIRIIAGENHMSSSVLSADFDDGATGSVLISLQLSRFFMHSVCYGAAFYIHGSNCYIGHDSGDAPGTRWMELMAGVMAYGFGTFAEFVHAATLADAAA